MRETAQSRRLFIFLIPALLLVLVATPVATRSAIAAPAGGDAWVTRSSDRAVVHFDPNLPATVDPDAFMAAYGDDIDTAVDELSLVVGLTVSNPIQFWITADFVTTGDPVLALFDPSDVSVVVGGVALSSATDADAENAIRNAVSQWITYVASGGALPSGFAEGMALYAERPLTSELSRYASLLQNANTAGELYSWTDLNRPQSGTDAVRLADAQRYAVTAYLFDHFGIDQYRAFVAEVAKGADWRSALAAAFGKPESDLEQAWRDDLSHWTSSGWKTNVIAGFDLDPARQLLARGNFAAAKADLEASERLFTQLGDQERVQIVQTLLNECDTGLQAESLMQQTSDALNQFSYDRASDLLTQAETQYANLPPDQRPTSVIESYRSLTNQGLTATAELAAATKNAHSWTNFVQARHDALDAGSTFAALGDTDRRADAQVVLQEIDRRQRRLVFLLGGLAVISLCWILLWRRYGLASAIRWPEVRSRRAHPSEVS